MGKRGIGNLWSGGSIDDLDSLFEKFSFNDPNTFYIICKTDGLAHFNFEIQDENAIFDIFNKTLNYDRNKYKIFYPSINYESLSFMKNTHDFSNLLLLPTPFTSEFNETQKITNFDSWMNKIDKAVWVGSPTGLFGENNHKGTRRNVYEQIRNDNNIVFKFITGNPQSEHDKQVNKHVKLYNLNMTNEDQMEYKMIICIDGWGFPGSLKWLLHSGCLPIIICDFKIGILKYLQPWKHYIPGKSDGSDITRNVEWALKNKSQCLIILKNLHEQISKFTPHFFENELQSQMLN